ncbi:hypothetical protein DMB95_04395 [Campylobacter sp. MIT 12-8780]|nr:hypothetical protein DMB95_04395 [Campylobacter sp. MIT 12-8780]
MRYAVALYSGQRYTFDESTNPMLQINVIPPRYTIDTKEENLAYELTPTFKFSDTGKIYVKFERGYITPLPTQLFDRRDTYSTIDWSTGAPYTQENPYSPSNVSSEHYDTYELGFSEDFFNFLSVQATGFYTITKGEIYNSGNPHFASENGSTQTVEWFYRNLDETKRLGVELSLRQDFGYLRLRQSFSHVSAKISKGIYDNTHMPYIPKNKVSLGVEYDLLKNLTLFADYTYIAKALDGGTTVRISGSEILSFQDQEYMPSYSLTDVGMSYQIQGLKIVLGVKNLFDRQYTVFQGPQITDPNRSGSRYYILGDGRSYYLNLRYDFSKPK